MFTSEMPDTRTGDEVDLLSRISAASEEEAVGNGAATPKMKQGPGTQAVSSICRPVWTKCVQLACSLQSSLLLQDRTDQRLYLFFLVLPLK